MSEPYTQTEEKTYGDRIRNFARYLYNVKPEQWEYTLALTTDAIDFLNSSEKLEEFCGTIGCACGHAKWWRPDVFIENLGLLVAVPKYLGMSPRVGTTIFNNLITYGEDTHILDITAEMVADELMKVSPKYDNKQIKEHA